MTESALRSALDALREIAEGDDHCACSHEDENCCAKAGYFCPRCIAAVALLTALPLAHGEAPCPNCGLDRETARDLRRWKDTPDADEIPAVFCEHANECPSTCPCPANCYCRRVGSAPACRRR